MNNMHPNSVKQSEWARFIEVVKKFPELQRKNNLYTSARGYDSWPHVQAHLFTLCIAVQKIAIDGMTPANRELAATAESGSVAMVALANDSPLRHLGADLAKAFIATKPLPCPSEAQMPYPSFILNLPRGLLSDDTGANINTLLIQSYDYWISKCQEKGVKISKDGDKMNDGGLQVVGLADDGTQLVRTVSWKEAHLTSDNEELFCSGFDSELVAGAVDRMMRIVLNSISVMTLRKDLITVEAITAGAGFSANLRSASKRPIYWIGKNYLRKQSASTLTTSSIGTKSPHWRSGHWHTIKHGKQRQQAKIVWFEPVYVNAAAKS